MNSAIALSSFIAAQVLYIWLFILLRLRPQILFSDETANQSAVQWFREPVASPYLFGYTPIMHAAHRRLMALVPPEKEIAIGRLANFVVILLHNFAMLALTASLFGLDAGCLVTAWWMLTCWGIGPHVGRLANYTERAFGDFFVFLGFAAFIATPAESYLLRILLIALPWTVVWHSSKFGVQAILLVSLMMTLIGASPVLLLGLGLSFVLAAILFGEVIIDQVKDQLWHLRWYWTLGEKYLDQDGAEGRRSGLSFVRWLLSWRIVKYNFVYAPTIVPIVGAWLLVRDGNSVAENLFAATALAGLVCSFGKGAILGPGIRYVYIVLPVALGELLRNFPELSIFLASVEIILAIVLTIRTLRRLTNIEDTSRAALLEVFRPLEKVAGVVMPSNLRIGEIILAVLRHPDFKIATFGQSRKYLSFVRRYYTPYPELTPDQELVNELVSQYSVDAMVVDRGSSAPNLPEILRNAGLREVKSVNQFSLFVRG